MIQSKERGFTLVELVLVISILGILAVAAIPSFINVSTQARQASRDGVTGAVRSGIALFRADDLVRNGAPGKYPALLDAAAAGSTAGPANLFFVNVLGQGIADKNWSKTADVSKNVYSYTDGTDAFVYTYGGEVTGTFASPTAP